MKDHGPKGTSTALPSDSNELGEPAPRTTDVMLRRMALITIAWIFAIHMWVKFYGLKL